MYSLYTIDPDRYSITVNDIILEEPSPTTHATASVDTLDDMMKFLPSNILDDTDDTDNINTDNTDNTDDIYASMPELELVDPDTDAINTINTIPNPEVFNHSLRLSTYLTPTYPTVGYSLFAYPQTIYPITTKDIESTLTTATTANTTVNTTVNTTAATTATIATIATTDSVVRDNRYSCIPDMDQLAINIGAIVSDMYSFLIGGCNRTE